MAVCKEYNQLLEKAVSKKTHIRNFFNVVKREDARRITRLFHQLHEEVFREIDCLKCANCCSSISPLITDKDVQKMAKALQKKPSEFTSTYLKVDDENDYVFKSTPCPFLDNKDNTCRIYDSRPKACREYPHTDHPDMRQILNITYNNSFICPAVYLIIKKIQDDYNYFSL
jgi:Fe-S-cluster containining protein